MLRSQVLDRAGKPGSARAQMRFGRDGFPRAPRTVSRATMLKVAAVVVVGTAIAGGVLAARSGSNAAPRLAAVSVDPATAQPGGLATVPGGLPAVTNAGGTGTNPGPGATAPGSTGAPGAPVTSPPSSGGGGTTPGTLAIVAPPTTTDFPPVISNERTEDTQMGAGNCPHQIEPVTATGVDVNGDTVTVTLHWIDSNGNEGRRVLLPPQSGGRFISYLGPLPPDHRDLVDDGHGSCGPPHHQPAAHDHGRRVRQMIRRMFRSVCKDPEVRASQVRHPHGKENPMKRSILVLSLTAAAALVVGACGSSSKSSTPGTAASTSLPAATAPARDPDPGEHRRERWGTAGVAVVVPARRPRNR